MSRKPQRCRDRSRAGHDRHQSCLQVIIYIYIYIYVYTYIILKLITFMHIWQKTRPSHNPGVLGVIFPLLGHPIQRGVGADDERRREA